MPATARGIGTPAGGATGAPTGPGGIRTTTAPTRGTTPAGGIGMATTTGGPTVTTGGGRTATTGTTGAGTTTARWVTWQRAHLMQQRGRCRSSPLGPSP